MDLDLFRLKLYSARLFWGLVGPVRQLYWRIFRPETRGVKCLVTCGNEVLLVRINYAHQKWSLPGGGVGRREDWKAAALREVKEETGVDIQDAIKVLEYFNEAQYKRDTVYIFRARLDHKMEPRADGIEIAETRWFPVDALPPNRHPRLDTFIPALL